MMQFTAAEFPERRSARLLIIDPEDRLLLFRYDDGREPPFWATPGGQLLPGETFEQAAARELAEETGFAAKIGRLVRTREAVFTAGDVGKALWIEHYFLVRAGEGAPDRTRWTSEEQRTIRATRWWSLPELQTASEPVLPSWLSEVLATLAGTGDAPAGRGER
jgi:ADP-ribose pyrophosphatase YjhB (NUDIX family)